jgi:hypothetical protein
MLQTNVDVCFITIPQHILDEIPTTSDYIIGAVPGLLFVSSLPSPTLICVGPDTTVFTIAFNDVLMADQFVEMDEYKATHKEVVPTAANLLNAGCSVSIGRVYCFLFLVWLL